MDFAYLCWEKQLRYGTVKMPKYGLQIPNICNDLGGYSIYLFWSPSFAYTICILSKLHLLNRLGLGSLGWRSVGMEERMDRKMNILPHAAR